MTQVFLMRLLEGHEKSQTKFKRIQRKLTQNFANLCGLFQPLDRTVTIGEKSNEF